MTGPDASAGPQGPNLAAMMSSMHHAGPDMNYFHVLPKLGFQVGMPQGLMNAKWGPFLFMSSQGRIGPFAGAQGMFARCFVSLSDFKEMVSGGVVAHSNIEAPHISGMPIEGERIEGVPIRGEEIRAAAASAGFVEADAPKVVAPRIAAHQAAMAAARGMDFD